MDITVFSDSHTIIVYLTFCHLNARAFELHSPSLIKLTLVEYAFPLNNKTTENGENIWSKMLHCQCVYVLWLCLLWGPEADWQETKQLWKQMATHDRKMSVINVMYYWKVSTGKRRNIFTSKHEWSFSLETINQQHSVISRNIRTGSSYKC